MGPVDTALDRPVPMLPSGPSTRYKSTTSRLKSPIYHKKRYGSAPKRPHGPKGRDLECYHTHLDGDTGSARGHPASGGVGDTDRLGGQHFRDGGSDFLHVWGQGGLKKNQK